MTALVSQSTALNPREDTSSAPWSTVASWEGAVHPQSPRYYLSEKSFHSSRAPVAWGMRKSLTRPSPGLGAAWQSVGVGRESRVFGGDPSYHPPVEPLPRQRLPPSGRAFCVSSQTAEIPRTKCETLEARPVPVTSCQQDASPTSTAREQVGEAHTPWGAQQPPSQVAPGDLQQGGCLLRLGGWPRSPNLVEASSGQPGPGSPQGQAASRWQCPA